MAADQTREPRRLRALPTITPTPDALPTDVPPPVLGAVGDPSLAREPELLALLREVDQLRTSLRSDLTLAATAAQAGEGEMAQWLVRTDEDAVHTFEERALGHLAAMDSKPGAVSERRTRRLRRMLPAAPMVAAAAAVLGILAGVVPNNGVSSPPAVTDVSAAMASYGELHRLALDGAHPNEMAEAAEQLHEDLAPLLAQAKGDPAAAQQALAMLQGEQAVLVAGGSTSLQVQAVLREARALVATLRAGLPTRRLAPGAPRTGLELSTQNEQRSTAKPKPKPSATPKPKPASPKPSASAKPSASPSSSSSSSSSSSPPAGGIPTGAPNPLP
ncbi:MAG TPA: hypothetical protein VNA30_03645 [Mycobacteriales bacterium]|nr:hypothetical protein [Mycobacteriales bacterium]